MDEYTADAWQDVLSCEPWITLDLAKSAAVATKRRQPFIDVSEIITEARRIRRSHIEVLEAERYRRQALEQAERRHEFLTLDRDKLEDPEPVREVIEDVRKILAEARERYRAQAAAS